jgi:hypothetical protein
MACCFFLHFSKPNIFFLSGSSTPFAVFITNLAQTFIERDLQLSFFCNIYENLLLWIRSRSDLELFVQFGSGAGIIAPDPDSNLLTRKSVPYLYFLQFFSSKWSSSFLITGVPFIQGGSDKSGIFFFLLSNDTAQLKIIRFD